MLFNVSFLWIYKILHFFGEDQVVPVVKGPFNMNVVFWEGIWPPDRLKSINKERLASVFSNIVLYQKAFANFAVNKSLLWDNLFCFKLSSYNFYFLLHYFSQQLIVIRVSRQIFKEHYPPLEKCNSEEVATTFDPLCQNLTLNSCRNLKNFHD